MTHHILFRNLSYGNNSDSVFKYAAINILNAAINIESREGHSRTNTPMDTVSLQKYVSFANSVDEVGTKQL